MKCPFLIPGTGMCKLAKPVKEPEPLLPVANPVGTAHVKLVDGELFKYTGNTTCCWLSVPVLNALEQVLFSIYRDYPETHRFIFGNACPLTGRCPENDSHVELRCLDIDYPTYSGNGTQYGGHEQIWSDGDQYSMVLDESKIHWKALWQFIVRLSKRCKTTASGMFDQGQSQIIIHTKMFQLIEKHISFNEMVYLNGVVSQDSSTGLNHHLHMHLKIMLKD
jgi:hypothetical protein